MKTLVQSCLEVAQQESESSSDLIIRQMERIGVLSAILRDCAAYIASVNADCPKGDDEDRDNLIERINKVLK